MKIEDYTYKGEFGAIIYDENTNQRIFFTWGELREIFDWVLENDDRMDKFEEWIKERIDYYETKDDELLYTRDEIIIDFYDCLKEYQRLKEKGEI